MTEKVKELDILTCVYLPHTSRPKNEHLARMHRYLWECSLPWVWLNVLEVRCDG